MQLGNTVCAAAYLAESKPFKNPNKEVDIFTVERCKITQNKQKKKQNK